MKLTSYSLRKPTSNIVASVIGLFFSCRPFHIARFVMPIVVFTIDRMFRARSFTNVFQKLRKGIESKLNTTTTVAAIVSYIRIGASGLRVKVSRELRSSFLVYRMSMPNFVSINVFKAPAALLGSFLHFLAHPYGGVATSTLAKPHRVPVCVFVSERQDSQVIKGLSGQILKVFSTLSLFGFHNQNYTMKPFQRVK